MAINTTQWSHALTIPESYTPSAATSGQTLVITESVIAKLSAGDQTTFWSNVQNGGGDVRICTDSGGVNQLPVEVVSLDSVAETCVIWTRKPSYDGTGNLYLFIGKAGETQPPVTDPFGRNAVWQDDYRRQGGDGQQDATGASTITLQGLSSTTSQKIKGFNALFFPFQDGSAEATSRAQFNGTSGANFTGDFTVSAWVKPESIAISFAQVIGIRGVSDWEFSLRLEGSQPAMLIGSSSPNSTGNLTVGVEQLLHATVSGSTISFYLNGSPIGTASISGTRVNRSQLLTFGGIDAAAATGTTFHGRIAEARAISGTALPSSHIATEYANQNDPATFFGTPTITTTATPTVDADANYTINAPTFTSSGSATLPQPIANGAFSVASPLFSASANASLPQPIVDAAFTLNAPTFSASASASVPSGDLYYLNFATDGYVSFSPLVSDVGSGYSWDIEFRAANNTSDEFIVLGESGNVGNFIIIRNNNTIDYRVDGDQKSYPITDKSNEDSVYRFEARGGVISLYENGILKGSNAFADVGVGGALDSGFSRIGNARGDITRNGALYYLKYTDNNNSANNRFFNPSSSGGTGEVLPDDDSTLNGSQVGTWPLDNSEWVFYSDAIGITSDVAFTVSAPSVSTNATATLPQPVANSAFSIASPSFSASANASLPQPVSDITFTVNTPSVTSNASVTLPGYSATVSFTVGAPSVSSNASATLPNPSADVSYTVSAPSISASASATLPNPVSDIAFSVSVPSVAASTTVTEPSFSANVAFTVSAPTVSISASAALPQPESTVSLAVSPPNVSVVAIVGGIAIIVDEETNINQRALSNNINAPILSNNING